MTSPDQLVPSQPAPARIEIEEVGANAAPLARSIYVRIWERLASGGRMAWTDDQWRDELSRPGVRTWVARVNGDIAGFVELEAETSGDVGIVVFGLVPEVHGQGLGGEFLAVAAETAWSIRTPTGEPTRRVWLQTSTGDHPHALSNYERRGFRTFETWSRR